MKQLEEGKPKSSMEQIRGHSQAARGLCQQWELLVVKDGVLHRRFESHVQDCSLLFQSCSVQRCWNNCMMDHLENMIERFNRTLIDILATSLQDHRFDWDKHLKMACFTYNTSVHSTTGYTPLPAHAWIWSQTTSWCNLWIGSKKRKALRDWGMG